MSKNNQLTPAQKNYLQVMKDLTTEVSYIMTPEQQNRFLAIAKQRFRQQPELGDCVPSTVFDALKELALSKVEPRLEHAFLNIRLNKDKQVKECHLQWQAEGKKRAINLATDGRYYVHAEVIKRKDIYKSGGIPRKVISHEYGDFEDRGDIVGAYAILMRAADDSQAYLIEMTAEEIRHVRNNYSDAYKAGTSEWKNGKRVVNKEDKSGTTWEKEFAEMCLKTVIGRLHKRIKANINTYIQQNALAINRADSQVEVSPYDVIDAEENPTIANSPDEVGEIDIERKDSSPD